MGLDEVRTWQAGAILPALSTVIVSGDVSHHAVMAAAHRAFDGWAGEFDHAISSAPATSPGRSVAMPSPAPRVLLVDRPERRSRSCGLATSARRAGRSRIMRW